MILTFFKGLLRELWLLVKDPRGIFMFLVAPLLMNIVVCGAFQNGIVNHIPLAAVEMSSSAKTRELIRAFDESDRFDVTLVLQDLDEAKQKMEEGEVYGIIALPIIPVPSSWDSRQRCLSASIVRITLSATVRLFPSCRS